MANDFLGSIAQNNLTYSISQTVTSVVGQNYYTPMIFIGSGANATANFVTAPGTVSITNVTNNNYTMIVKGTLLTWLTNYFAVNNSLSSVNIVSYDSTVASYGGIAAAFALYKDRSYQKFVFESATAAKTALATLCAADTLLSQFWTEADSGALAAPQTTGITYALAQVPVKAVAVYSAQSGLNPALVALGLQLSYLNASGVSVGNAPDYNQTTQVLASGTTGGSDNSNLSATQMANLATNGVLYFETVGNSTGSVAIVGDQNTIGGYPSADWFSAYLQYVSQVNGATYLTTPPRKTKVETTYNGLLSILQNNATPFTQGSYPVISNFQLVAYPFAKAPTSAGNAFIITGPNGYAWTATFNRGIKTATVTGNLTIQA